MEAEFVDELLLAEAGWDQMVAQKQAKSPEGPKGKRLIGDPKGMAG